MDRKQFDESLNFVARHFRRDAFSVDNGLRAVGLGGRRLFWLPASWPRSWRVAAASVAGVVLAATAAVTAWVVADIPSAGPAPADSVPQVVEQPAPRPAVNRVEFSDESLATVVAEIERVYGVKVSGLDPQQESLRVTLSFSGTSGDLLEAINDLLGTKLTIEK